MLKHVEELRKAAEHIGKVAGDTGADAVAAVESLKAFRSWAEKSKAAQAEQHDAIVTALAERSAATEAEFDTMIESLTKIIDKLEGENVERQDN